jgi:hypothetical protein
LQTLPIFNPPSRTGTAAPDLGDSRKNATQPDPPGESMQAKMAGRASFAPSEQKTKNKTKKESRPTHQFELADRLGRRRVGLLHQGLLDLPRGNAASLQVELLPLQMGLVGLEQRPPRRPGRSRCRRCVLRLRRHAGRLSFLLLRRATAIRLCPERSCVYLLCVGSGRFRTIPRGGWEGRRYVSKA